MEAVLFVLGALVLFLVCCLVDRWFFERIQRKWEREIADSSSDDSGAD